MALVLLVFAFVFFVIGIFRTNRPLQPGGAWYWGFNWVSAGLAAWVLTLLVPLLFHGAR